MRTIIILILFCIPALCKAQKPQVVVFKHELRWTDEAKFPNYFTLPWVMDSVFNRTGVALKKYLGVSDITFPEKIQYKIIPGFSKQKTDMPQFNIKDTPSIGIFSFITRATVGYAMLWNFRIIIELNNKVILNKEVSHELEYFNASGYLGSVKWISEPEFQYLFDRMVNETLGFLPSSDEKIILGSLESFEKKARTLMPGAERTLLKINGGWKTGGNFNAFLESEKDTMIKFNFDYGILWELPLPSISGALSAILTEATGINFVYDQKIKNQLKGTLNFQNDQKFGIKLKWIEYETRSVKTGDVLTTVSDPYIAELYDEKKQAGGFVYSFRSKVLNTATTVTKFNYFSGSQVENSLGVERIHTVKGLLNGTPALAEFNEGSGLITMKSNEDTLAIMVVQNCNPESTSISNQKISKNKVFISSSEQRLSKPSLDNKKNIEWYPMFFKENLDEDSKKTCIKILICMFFGIANMSQGMLPPSPG